MPECDLTSAPPRRRVRRQPRRKQEPAPGEEQAYTLRGFCTAHHISMTTYYKLKKDGQAPDEMRVSDRVVLISYEAAARWRKAREDAATKPQ